MKRTILAVVALSAASVAMAGGNHYPQKQQSTAAIAGASSAAEAKSIAASLSASGATGGSNSLGGNKTIAIGSASAPSPAQCVVVLPELFGAVTIMVDNRTCQLGNLSRGYLDVGDLVKAEKVLDAMAAELKVKVE